MLATVFLAAVFLAAVFLAGACFLAVFVAVPFVADAFFVAAVLVTAFFAGVSSAANSGCAGCRSSENRLCVRTTPAVPSWALLKATTSDRSGSQPT